MRISQDAISSRRDRMRCFFDFIEKHGRDYERKKLLAIYSVKEGIAERTLLQYLQAYLDAELIMAYGNKVMTAPQYVDLKEADLQRARELAGDGGGKLNLGD